jgi:membrane protein
MPNLWTLGGLSIPQLLRRTARESWQDAVFGQGGRMAFYHFLAIFPSLFVFLAISARIPHLADHMKNTVQGLSAQMLPDQVSQLFQKTMAEVGQRTLTGVQLIPVCAGAAWAFLNATWAMIYGLNRAYEVEETRSWRELAVTIVGLTLSLAVTASVAVFLIFFGTYFQSYFHVSSIIVLLVKWTVVAVSLTLSFAVLYRFAPNLRDCEWRWSTPGALCALILWLCATFVARIYFEHINNYVSSYGRLNGVVILLLWLYVTNGAILIGGEMNSEIEKAAAKRRKAA